MLNNNNNINKRLSYILQIAEFILFLLVFLPLAFIEVLKFADVFKMKKLIIFIISINILFNHGFFIGAGVSSYKCSFMVQYIPPALYILILLLYN